MLLVRQPAHACKGSSVVWMPIVYLTLPVFRCYEQEDALQGAQGYILNADASDAAAYITQQLL